MRRMFAVSSLVLLALPPALAAWGAPALAAPIPDAPGDSIRVTLDRSEIHDVAYVEYMSLGVLRLVTSSGRTKFVGVHRVLSIEGESGHDFTDAVIEKRGRAGESPAAWAPSRRRPGFLLRGRPPPECTSFAITEMGYLASLHSVDAARGDREGSFVVEYGWMKNRSPSNALGVVAHLDVGSYRARFGPALRYRRWLSRRTAIDYEAGVLLLGSEDDPEFDFKAPGFLGQVNWQVEGILSITAQAESRAVRSTGPPDLAPGIADQHGIDLRLGAKLGSGVGLGAMGGAAAAFLALLVIVTEIHASP